MPTTKVAEVVENLTYRPEPEEKQEIYTQSTPIAMGWYYLLSGLAKSLGTTRTALAGMLLTAAIEDAVAALPTDGPAIVGGEQYDNLLEAVSIEATRLQAERQAAKATT
jgi:hypothetical protein